MKSILSLIMQGPFTVSHNPLAMVMKLDCLEHKNVLVTITEKVVTVVTLYEMADVVAPPGDQAKV